MKKVFIVIVFFLVSRLTFDVLHLYAQPVTQEWVATYVRNAGGGEAQGPFYALDKHGSSFVAGPNFINDTNNIVVVKYNSFGVQQWAVTYKYPGYGYIYPIALSLDSSGNPVVASTYGQTGFPPQNFLTVKFNGISGLVMWAKTYNGVNVGPGDLDMKIDKHNNIFLVSTLGGTGTDSSICIKYNENGDTLWKRTWHPQGSGRYAFGCAIDDSSNIIITGIASTVINSFSYDSLLTMKYSTDGFLRWDRTFAYNASYTAQNQGQKVTTDQFGNIYVSGRTSASASNVGFLTLKYDLNGNLLWASRYYQLYENYVSAITVDRIHNCVFVTGQGHASNQIFAITIKYDSHTGDSLWIRRDTGSYHYYGTNDIKVDSLGNSYVTGSTYNVNFTMSAILTKQYDSQGFVIWQVSCDSGSFGAEGALGRQIALDNLNNVYICGLDQQLNFIVAKYSQTTGIIRTGNSIPGKFCLSSSPNPFNPQTSINFNIPFNGKVTIKVYDILGRVVEILGNEKELKAGEYKLLLDGSNFASGIYFCRFNVSYNSNNNIQNYSNAIKLVLAK